MINILIDFILNNYTEYTITTYLYNIENKNILDHSLSMFLLYILNNDFYIILKLTLIYIISKIIYRYINTDLITKFSIFTLLYILLINRIDISYLLNLFLLIFLYFKKYNINGENINEKNINKDINTIKYNNHFRNLTR